MAKGGDPPQLICEDNKCFVILNYGHFFDYYSTTNCVVDLDLTYTSTANKREKKQLKSFTI